MKTGWRGAITVGLTAAAIEILLGRYAGADRVEPGLFLLWRMPVLAVLALVLARSGHRVRVCGYAAMILAASGAEGVLAGRMTLTPVVAGAALAIIADLVMRAGMAIWGRWLAACALLLMLAVPGAGRWVQRLGAEDGVPMATGLTVTVLAGVPLRRPEGVDLSAVGDAPGWRLLARAFDLRAVDRIADARAGRWLLVQPRAPGPAGLVAIDARIRAGVQAVMLTDPDLRWPSRYPAEAGPPRSGTLAPLLVHWGLELERGAVGLTVRDVAWGGRRWRLALSGAGRFRAAGRGPCRLLADGLIADCTIGQGRAWLVADADLMDPDLWSDPDGGHAPAFRPSDNVAFVMALVAGADRISPPVRPVLWTDHGMESPGLGMTAHENP